MMQALSKKSLLMGPIFCVNNQMMVAHVEAGICTSSKSYPFAMSLDCLSRVETLYGSEAHGEQDHIQTFQSFD